MSSTFVARRAPKSPAAPGRASSTGSSRWAQIQRGARLHPQSFSFPTEGRIEDAPRHGLARLPSRRGAALLFARGGRAVPRHPRLEQAQRLPLAPVSDDEAWRVEIDAYPRADRKGRLARPRPGRCRRCSAPGRSRPAATTARTTSARIVALGEEFGIEIVPEIDVPGHCYAMLQALPQLKDPGENGLYHSIQAFPEQLPQPGGRGRLRRDRDDLRRDDRALPLAPISMSGPTRCRTTPGRPRPRPRHCGKRARRRRARRRCRRASCKRIQAFLTSQGQDHRRLGRSRAGRRHRQGQLLPRRLAQGGGEPASSPPRATTWWWRRGRPTTSTWPTARTGTSAAPPGPAGRRPKTPTRSSRPPAGARPSATS